MKKDDIKLSQVIKRVAKHPRRTARREVAAGVREPKMRQRWNGVAWVPVYE